MATYVYQVREATSRLKNFSIAHIPWSENYQANGLSKLASSSADGEPKRIQWEMVLQRSIEPRQILWLDRSST